MERDKLVFDPISFVPAISSTMFVNLKANLRCQECLKNEF